MAAIADDRSNANTAMPAQQEDMIRSMVDGLAARLDSSPRDVEGWVKLLRSRVVLGERDLATKALGRALDVFASEPE
jgi:cytochrome c-type biogenesis protein CcmH